MWYNESRIVPIFTLVPGLETRVRVQFELANVNDKIVFLKKHNNDVNVNKYKHREKLNIYQEISQSN